MSKQTPWEVYLASKGASFEAYESNNSIARFPKHIQSVQKDTWMCSLDHLGLISISGPDASRFLQGQLTCDVNSIDFGQVVDGAGCNPKGRMYTSFTLINVTDNQDELFWMRSRRSLIESSLENLKKYIVFFKSEMKSLASQYIGIGIGGTNAAKCVSTLFGTVPTLLNSAITHEIGFVLNASEHSERFECWVNLAFAEQAWETCSNLCTPVSTHHWLAQNFANGKAEVSADTIEMFTPHMLNYPARGAVSFNKGCYTGQEIVARTEYLGKAKRVLVSATCDETVKNSPPLGSELKIEGKYAATLVDAIPPYSHNSIDSPYQAQLVIRSELASADKVTLESETGPITLRISNPD